MPRKVIILQRNKRHSRILLDDAAGWLLVEGERNRSGTRDTVVWTPNWVVMRRHDTYSRHVTDRRSLPTPSMILYMVAWNDSSYPIPGALVSWEGTQNFQAITKSGSDHFDSLISRAASAACQSEAVSSRAFSWR
jgi:hypothetical protein